MSMAVGRSLVSYRRGKVALIIQSNEFVSAFASNQRSLTSDHSLRMLHRVDDRNCLGASIPFDWIRFTWCEIDIFFQWHTTGSVSCLRNFGNLKKTVQALSARLSLLASAFGLHISTQRGELVESFMWCSKNIQSSGNVISSYCNIC